MRREREHTLQGLHVLLEGGTARFVHLEGQFGLSFDLTLDLLELHILAALGVFGLFGVAPRSYRFGPLCM